ncbi:MAG: recombinase family protein [Planctomycetes bacterium]|nr:recombinase family protein [Planctomycetota bacterium]
MAAIRRVFWTFAFRGYSTPRIAKRLNSKHVPSPGGNGWTARHVQACLRATAYAAPIAYQRKKPHGVQTALQWVLRPKPGEGHC